LIGPSEREIRYENLVQRLLRRGDNQTRRVVCLSAILPEGEQLDDLTAWIRSDVPGVPIQSRWRPTRQRFGTVAWHGASAKLNFNLESDAPYILHFVRKVPAIRPRRLPFPNDTRELTLATAWRFSALGKRALVFCTQRDHVEGYAEAVVDLNRRGFLPSLLSDPSKVERAVEVGREWLGEQHPAVKCLPLGVAIHHARLPSPFLREVEALLAGGVLEVVIASPTLAQGLNLNAAVLLIPSLYRAGIPLTGEEFANVAGRAGRAFVDLDGLILHVMYEPEPWRIRNWTALVTSSKARSLASGIISVVNEVMTRLGRTGVYSRPDAMEYLANSQEAWFPGDLPDDNETIADLIERLDATVLGLVEALDCDTAQLPALLDAALTGSLWSRQLGRLAVESKQYQLWIINARAKLIWNKSTPQQRRSQFAMGVGLESGLALDAISTELTAHLDKADAAAMQGNASELAAAFVAMADRLFQIRPFIPSTDLPENWRELLTAWISGVDVGVIGIDNMQLVEEAFIYRLTWAAEALRMKRRAEGGASPYVEGGAAACLEAGLPHSRMAMLVRSGLPSRVAAKKVVEETKPAFMTISEMNFWLSSNEIAALSDGKTWPTPETSAIWQRFRQDALSGPIQRWTEQEWTLTTDLPKWSTAGYPARIQTDEKSGRVSVTSPDFREITGIQQRLSEARPSLMRVDFAADGKSSTIRRVGKGKASWVSDK
jgi:hypothetical protein